MKPNENGTASEKWLHQVGYLSPKARKAAGGCDQKVCCVCWHSSSSDYTTRDGTYGTSLKCGHVTVPARNGLTVKENATCSHFRRHDHD